MPMLAISMGLLGAGILRRFFWLLPAFLLDPFDLYERYLYSELGWDLTVPDWYFPAVLVGLVFWTAMLTFHEERTKGGSQTLTFRIREYHASLSTYNRSRPQQPYPTIEVTAKGRLENNNSRRATVESVTARLYRKRFLWWRKVADASLVTLKSFMGGSLDPNHHIVQVDGDSTNDLLHELWPYFHVPDDWTLETLRSGRYRVAINVNVRGKGEGSPTLLEFGLAEQIEAGQRNHERFMAGPLGKAMDESHRFVPVSSIPPGPASPG